MAGKKKNMQGGIFGLNPSYENKTINDIAYKIIYGKKEENRMVGFKSFNNANYLRAEQRINAFFQKLKQELETNPNKVRLQELFKYYNNIIKKYPDKISEIRQREEDTFTVVDNFFKSLNNQNIKSTSNLINEYELLNAKLLPNKTGKTGIIQLSNDEKEEMSNRIVKLAEEIYKKAILLKYGPDFTSLKKSLTSLYYIYRVIFIDKFRISGQNLKNVEGVANNKKQIAINLKEKNNKLTKKPKEPMSILYNGR